MAEKSYFFNDVNNDRVYLAEDFARYFSTLIANGVFPNPSTNVQVLANIETLMTVKIMPGFAWINGYMYWNQVNMVKTLEPAYTNPRIDRVVIRWTSNTRDIKLYVLTGTPAATPVAPVLTRNSDVWELGIADIYVGGGVTAISQANITDLRLNNTYCGVVHALVQQVETTTLFNQYQAWYGEMTTVSKAEFDNWMASLANILSGDVAGNLLTLIQTNEADIRAVEDKISSGSISTTWVGSTPPFTQAFSNANVTTTNIVEISLASTATTAQTKAWDALKLKDGGQSAGSFTVKCWGVKNSITIPIVISVRGA